MAVGKGTRGKQKESRKGPCGAPSPRPQWGLQEQGNSSLRSTFHALAKAIKVVKEKVAYKKGFNTKHVMKTFPNLWLS